MDDSITKYGIKFLLSGDIEAAKEKLHDANLLMFQTKLQNTNGLDIIKGNRRFDDGTTMEVLSQHGMDTARIYVPPKSSIGGGDREVIEEIIEEDRFDYEYVPTFIVKTISGEIGAVICTQGDGFDGSYVYTPPDKYMVTWKDFEPTSLEEVDGKWPSREPQRLFDEGKAQGLLESQPLKTPLFCLVPEVYDKFIFVNDTFYEGQYPIRSWSPNIIKTDGGTEELNFYAASVVADRHFHYVRTQTPEMKSWIDDDFSGSISISSQDLTYSISEHYDNSTWFVGFNQGYHIDYVQAFADAWVVEQDDTSLT